MQTFSPGTIVAARGREWIVLPDDMEALLRLRPLAGSAAEQAAVLMPLEGSKIAQATFPRPSGDALGDAQGLLTLLDAARLSLRAGAAPFRSLGRISVTPRPYQFVPLLMALRQSPIRLLLADDVGVGKTIEAGLIARELLDRGIAKRLGVLAPAHLCDQWHGELLEKFTLPSEVIRPSTLARLERRLPRADVSVYQWPDALIASIDYAKSPSQREAFLRHAPDLIIVDEAHGCANPPDKSGKSQQLRHELLKALMEDKSRHLILVTATPHSGVDASFRSLVGLLDRTLVEPHPEGRAAERRRLVPYIIQRRRKDVEQWMGEGTAFPKRVATEATYQLSGAYYQFFRDVLDYCRELTSDRRGGREAQRRVRHWAAIAMLRGVLSSPQAAAAVLKARAQRKQQAADGEAGSLVDERYKPHMLDVLGDAGDGDYVPTGAIEDPDAAWSDGEIKKLRELAQRAEDLAADKDKKLDAIAKIVGELLREGYRPIVFCRFIETAKYLAAALERKLKRQHRGLQCRAVTGELGDEARREVVEQLSETTPRVLVATDCLSEGINLQEHYDAVIHADLPWNPNRLEQREGRVDRFGQGKSEVRTVVVYGSNNDIDLVVLDVLIRKARKIYSALGVAVPVPADAQDVLDAVIGSVLKGTPNRGQYELALDDSGTSELHAAWDEAVKNEKEAHAFFRQHRIQPAEVQTEIEATDDVLGDHDAVVRFLKNALPRFQGGLQPIDNRPGVFALSLGDVASHLPASQATSDTVDVVVDRLADVEATYIGRTHPFVAATADAVLAEAFEPELRPRFARAGAVLTSAVSRVTAVLLLRFRYTFSEEIKNFAEEVRLVAFERRKGRYLPVESMESAARELIEGLKPAGNFDRESDRDRAERKRHVDDLFAALDREPDWYKAVLAWRIKELTSAHKRLRKLTREGKFKIESHPPPDVMACLALVPAGAKS